MKCNIAIWCYMLICLNICIDIHTDRHTVQKLHEIMYPGVALVFSTAGGRTNIISKKNLKYMICNQTNKGLTEVLSQSSTEPTTTCCNIKQSCTNCAVISPLDSFLIFPFIHCMPDLPEARLISEVVPMARLYNGNVSAVPIVQGCTARKTS